MLSHANLWLGAVSVAHYLGLSATDRTLCVLPLAFDYGQNQLLSTWYAGGEAIAFDYLLPRDVVRAVERSQATVLAGVPPLWVQLAEQEWGRAGASLTTLTNSGGHMPEPLVRRLRTLFPQARLHLMYGLTEAFRSASLDPALVDAKPDAVGSAIPFAELSVRRADGSEAAAGEEGELVHAGPLVAQGYWGDAERTAQRFRGGAVWSGDRVVIGDDGLLRIRGRDDAMIKVSGHRVSPSEVEEAAVASGAVEDASFRRICGLARCGGSMRCPCRPTARSTGRRCRRRSAHEGDGADPGGLCSWTRRSADNWRSQRKRARRCSWRAAVRL
jgi:acyl-CoA synthetase (AMP-forming)/AMP-acid ligase II